jgi:fumarate reductase subunit D
MTDSFFKHDHETGQNSDTPVRDVDRDTIDSEFADNETSSSVEDVRLASVMCYVPLLCFVPLLNMRDNKDIRFHARQGVILFMIEILAVLFLVDWVSRFVFKGVLILAAILSATAIYSTLQGKRFRLPIIGDIADKMKI